MKSNDELETQLLKECKDIVPKLTHDLHKGMAGRIGIIGGSKDYTGAPYFAAISALKVGCDLVHVFCAKEAAPIIKSYSPELIVHPVLDADNALDLVLPWLPRLHVLVIGPGLGREESIMLKVEGIIRICRENPDLEIPLVIDADGLFMVCENPKIIKDYPHGAVLTPNIMEYKRLTSNLMCCDQPLNTVAEALGTNIVVLVKGAHDMIGYASKIKGSEDSPKNIVECTASGSARRCGGQGDLLSGSLGTFYYWAHMKAKRCSTEQQFPPGVVAAYAACRLTKECNQRAVAKCGRSTLTTDMLKEIHSAFEFLFEK
ncbi:ATP-dependent (S)-NAD(P)H-hydrate dehydratase [Blattella germanica]|nr:ATP-dependent (S)-NAD(P)H-hydrate dehydratase [Blattella germanica]